MKILCSIFGHKWLPRRFHGSTTLVYNATKTCARCALVENLYVDFTDGWPQDAVEQKAIREANHG